MTKLPVIRDAFKFAYRNLLPRVSPELTLAARHLKVFGNWPNLRRPITFNEKFHWKKLNARRAVVARTSDKFAVRHYVRAKGLDDILIPLLWQGIDPRGDPVRATSAELRREASASERRGRNRPRQDGR